MLNTDAKLKEIYITTDNVTHAYTVPSAVCAYINNLENDLDDKSKSLAELTKRVNEDVYTTASKVIVNLKSDRKGTCRLLTKTEFSAFDEYYYELEYRIAQALRGKTLTGSKITDAMLPKVYGDDAAESIATARDRASRGLIRTDTSDRSYRI